MQVEMIKPGAIIDLKVSASYLIRLQEVLTWLITSQDTEIVKQANERIGKGEELEEWDEHYATLLSLISSLEDAAREQGKTEMMNME